MALGVSSYGFAPLPPRRLVALQGSGVAVPAGATDRPAIVAGGPAVGFSVASVLKSLWSRLLGLFRRYVVPAGNPVPAGSPAPLPPAVPVHQGPVTVDDVKVAAREYLAAHPEIAELPSYDATAQVARMRDGVLAILAAKGIRGGRILDPDGQPYYQVIAIGNPGDAQAITFRVTAGGGPVRQALEAAYSDGPVPWGEVR